MIKVYNQSLQLVAFLQNAFSIGYETPLNSLWMASFSLPADDPKNEECLPLRFVEIFDGNNRVELFRIMPNTARRSNDGKSITYQCEHALATLLDDVLFQFHQVGNLGYYTDQVMSYVLAKQTVTRWQLGTISFQRQFEYSWENENLLAALFSVPKPFTNEYMFTWDTSTYPWTLNLVEPPLGVHAHIRYGFNLKGIEKVTDPFDICTRLYCLGYGEGVNQLSISDVNGGLPYLDADTQAQYGIINRIFVDRRFTSAETLKARGEAMLEDLKMPRITYSVDAAELHALTNDPIDQFTTGTQVRVIDEELGIDVITRVVNKRRPDIKGSPGDVYLEIANKPQDIAGSIAELADRQRINEVYAQGATNIDSHDFTDNCDPDNPAVLRFYVAEEAIRINKVQLSFSSESFRAYSKAIEGGGGISTTTEGGGSFTSPVTSEGGGGDVITSGDSGIDVIYGTGVTQSAGDPPHIHYFRDVQGHKHLIDIPSHTHIVDITIPDHAHDIELPDHTHEIEYGIYKGPVPTELSIKIDGNALPITDISGEDIDIIPYLSKDGDGRVGRGSWHEITITPNNLARISASVFIQCFIQSRGGVDV